MADAVVDEIRAAGGKAARLYYDSVASAAGGEAIVATAIKAFGRLDVLINNAGTLRNAPLDELLRDSTIDAMLEVHLKGAFNVTRPAFIPVHEENRVTEEFCLRRPRPACLATLNRPPTAPRRLASSGS